ncbi:response regulator transcription factor, partial [Nocardioides sp.]|uniref:response regulator transcription factor n=1 Tax=Nocardioides sp. TaxID=35761 RepID=UPI0010A2FB64
SEHHSGAKWGCHTHPDADRARELLGEADHALSPRETQVLQLIVAGHTNAEIAANLHLSERTVHRHVSNILTKLGLPSRTAAAIHAVRNGLV